MIFELTDTLREKLELLEQCILALPQSNLLPSGNERLDDWRLNAQYIESVLVPLPGRILLGQSPQNFELADFISFFNELNDIKPSLSEEEIPFWKKYHHHSERLKKIYLLLIGHVQAKTACLCASAKGTVVVKSGINFLYYIFFQNGCLIL